MSDKEEKKEEKAWYQRGYDNVVSTGKYINEKTTLSKEQKESIEATKIKAKEQLAKAKVTAGEWSKATMAWLKVSSNRSMLLVAILLFMILLNFSLFMSINFDDLDEKGEAGDSARSKVAHLKNISITTFIFALMLGVNVGLERFMKPIDIVITEI